MLVRWLDLEECRFRKKRDCFLVFFLERLFRFRVFRVRSWVLREGCSEFRGRSSIFISELLGWEF